MKILITGASGFIGKACMNYFSQNHDVIGVDYYNNGSENIHIETDFSVTKGLIEKTCPDIIINCAGTSNIQESFSNTLKDFSSNTAFVQLVLDTIKSKSPETKFVQLSSAAVYGNVVNLPINEDALPNPISPYGFHKLLSEKLVSHYHKLFKINTVSVRIFSAYGDGLRRQFIFDLYSKFASNSKAISLFGTGNESRDFIHISDIIRALDIIIKNAQFEGEVYNLASGQESFINSTSALFAEICNYSGEINFVNSAIDGYPINWRADISKLAKLGFKPQMNLDEGLKKYYTWIKDNFNQ